MSELQYAFCKGLTPLNKEFALMGIFFRNVDFDDDDDLSDLIVDEEHSQAEIEI